ncbi:MAG: protein arginine kinase, partial [Candidatus Subteraquimicrobiales bacterium]|nr:protein arginine kinase [Candidatus Subteraquimicrobiales bacterium]
VSPNFFDNSSGRAVILSSDGKVGLMVNEEDHLRIQALSSGLCLFETWHCADKIDESLSVNLEYAFGEHLGYLASCPTNVGTGLRASVMFHLPGLVLTNQTQGVVKTLITQNFAVRGLFGEGTRATGNLYQISNQATLGKSEEEIIESLSKGCERIIRSELAAREQLMKEMKNEIIDRVYRAKGILAHAHMLNFEEAVELLSVIWLGAEIKILPGLETLNIGETLFSVGSGHLQAQSGKTLSEERIELERAKTIKRKFEIYGGF